MNGMKIVGDLFGAGKNVSTSGWQMVGGKVSQLKERAFIFLINSKLESVSLVLILMRAQGH